MKVAALYDVHGMPWALEAVLADTGDVDAILFGGDLIYGPYPSEVVNRVRSLDASCVRGNCESKPDDWDRSRLDAAQLEWLATLPLTQELDGVLYCHATPTGNEPRTTAATPDEAITEMFAGIAGTVVIGHTHHQFDRRVGDLRVVNAGSVGMPYESEVAAFWTLVEDGEPTSRKTSFDVERAIAEVERSGWPPAAEFVEGNLRVAVDRGEAIARRESRR